MTEKIGFVGVGRMGANMARRLKDVGFPVTAVYDVRKESAQTLAQELNAEACSKLARVTQLSDVVFTVVTDDVAMRKIYGLGAKKGDSLLTNARGGATVKAGDQPKTPKTPENRGLFGRLLTKR